MQCTMHTMRSMHKEKAVIDALFIGRSWMDYAVYYDTKIEIKMEEHKEDCSAFHNTKTKMKID